MSFFTRRTLEDATSYQQAKHMLSNATLIAPVYFILGGTKSHEVNGHTVHPCWQNTPTAFQMRYNEYLHFKTGRNLPFKSSAHCIILCNLWRWWIRFTGCLWLKPVGLVQRLVTTWRHSVFIRWTEGTLAMASPWRQHYKFCRGYCYTVIILNPVSFVQNIKYFKILSLMRFLLQIYCNDVGMCHYSVAGENRWYMGHRY